MKERTVVRKRVNGEIRFNDGYFAVVETVGIDGIEKDLFLSEIQIHLEDTAGSPEEFLRKFPVGASLGITTITEIELKD